MSKKLIGRSALVGIGTLCSRILGLARDIIILGVFGSSVATDAFFAAFKVPNFFRRIFAEGAFSQAFMPVFTEAQQISKQDAKLLFQVVLAKLLGIVAGLCIIVILLTPIFAMIFGFGWFLDRENSPRYDMMTDMLRITFPFLWFITFVSLASSVLNSYDKFFAPAFAPVFLNISFIVAAIFFAQRFGYSTAVLAWAVVVAGLLQSIYLLWELKKIGMLVWPSLKKKHKGTAQIIKLMLPGMFAVSVTQLNLLIDSGIATLFKDGHVVTWLYYGLRLSELPLGIIGIAIATVILPVLSRQHIQKDQESFEQTIIWAVRMVIFIGVPAMSALIYLSVPLLSTLFLHGKTLGSDVLASSNALMAYACALPAFMIIKVLVPAFFAQKNTKTPVKIGLVAVFVNIVANIVLAWSIGFVGLAIATAVSAWSHAIILLIVMLKQRVIRLEFVETLNWVRAVLAAVFMVLVLIYVDQPQSWWLTSPEWQRARLLLVMVLIGVVSYIVSLLLLGVRFRHLKSN